MKKTLKKINKNRHMKAMKAVALAELRQTPSVLKLRASEVSKITEILELTAEETMKMKKRFTSINKIDEKTVIVKDWLDDSIQIVKIK